MFALQLNHISGGESPCKTRHSQGADRPFWNHRRPCCHCPAETPPCGGAWSQERSLKEAHRPKTVRIRFNRGKTLDLRSPTPWCQVDKQTGQRTRVFRDFMTPGTSLPSWGDGHIALHPPSLCLRRDREISSEDSGKQNPSGCSNTQGLSALRHPLPSPTNKISNTLKLLIINSPFST